MTTLLVSVTSADEARAAIAAGANLIGALDPAGGPLGSLPAVTVRAIVAAVDGRAEVVAAGGDGSTAALAELAEAGADALLVPVASGDAGAAVITQVGRALAGKVKLYAAFAPAAGPDFDLVPVTAMAGFAGVTLTAPDDGDGLVAAVKMVDIARFVASARRAKLAVGLTGGLKVVDIGTLLPLKPDFLGFRAAVSEDEVATQALDPARVRAAAAALAIHAARLTQDE